MMTKIQGTALLSRQATAGVPTAVLSILICNVDASPTFVVNEQKTASFIARAPATRSASMVDIEGLESSLETDRRLAHEDDVA